jgi:hypothetical protein
MYSCTLFFVFCGYATIRLNGLRVLCEGRTAVDELKVCVHGGAKLRFAIAGDAGLLHPVVSDGQICVSGGLPRREMLEDAPSAWTYGPVLDAAWDDAGTWSGVGVWLEGLLRAVPRDDAAVKAQARALLAAPGPAATADDRSRLEALLRFVRQSVRYVGVEVGVGGYRPQAAAAVLSQRWGDCKGKALLLIDLLREAGIGAYPVLIKASASASPDPAFATPFGFNHMIVGVAGQAIAPAGRRRGRRHSVRRSDARRGRHRVAEPRRRRASRPWSSMALRAG